MLLGRKNKNPIKIADKGVVEWKYATCGYCSTGCSIEVGLDKNGNGVSARGVADADVNQGKLCIKGIFENELFTSAGRGLYPLMRENRWDEFNRASWDDALDKTASEIKRIQEQYGRDAFSIVSTGQIMTEEFYTLGKLSRGVIGTNNYDGNTTLCMASAVSGYKRSFGSDGPPGCYEDFEKTDCLLAIGSNLPEQHPIIYWRMREAREKRHFPLIVVDPRVTMLSQFADVHLPVTPGTDVVLLRKNVGMILIMIWKFMYTTVLMSITSRFSEIRPNINRRNVPGVVSVRRHAPWRSRILSTKPQKTWVTRTGRR